MSKAKTGLMILFFVACICAFIQRVSAPPATTYIASALILISTITAITLGPRRWRTKWFARRAVPTLLILLSPALSWATFPTSFQNVVNILPVGSTSLGNPQDIAVDSLGNVYVADSTHNQVIEITAAGVASVVTFPSLSPALHTPTSNPEIVLTVVYSIIEMRQIIVGFKGPQGNALSEFDIQA